MASQVSQSTQLGSAVAFLVLATVAVALRLYSKTFTKARFAVDDWVISLSLVCLYAWIGVQCWGKFSQNIKRFCRAVSLSAVVRHVFRRWLGKDSEGMTFSMYDRCALGLQLRRLVHVYTHSNIWIDHYRHEIEHNMLVWPHFCSCETLSATVPVYSDVMLPVVARLYHRGLESMSTVEKILETTNSGHLL